MVITSASFWPATSSARGMLFMRSARCSMYACVVWSSSRGTGRLVITWFGLGFGLGFGFGFGLGLG